MCVAGIFGIVIMWCIEVLFLTWNHKHFNRAFMWTYSKINTTVINAKLFYLTGCVNIYEYRIEYLITNTEIKQRARYIVTTSVVNMLFPFSLNNWLTSLLETVTQWHTGTYSEHNPYSIMPIMFKLTRGFILIYICILLQQLFLALNVSILLVPSEIRKLCDWTMKSISITFQWLSNEIT